MSAIDNSEVDKSNLKSEQEQDEQNLAGLLKTTNPSDEHVNLETYKIRKPKRTHFSDGTLEEFDSEDFETEHPNQIDEKHFHKINLSDVQAGPSVVNPKSLSWPAWFQHYTSKSAHKTLDVLDSAGETIAYYLGITTPKYQYEIDEYKRLQEEAAAKQKQKDEELASWGSSGSVETNVTPITEQLHKSLSVETKNGQDGEINSSQLINEKQSAA